MIIPTPARKTHIFFDTREEYVSEPAVVIGRNASQMFQGVGAEHNSLAYQAGGWGVRCYLDYLYVATERTELNNGFWLTSNGRMTVSSEYEEQYMTRKPGSEMPNATTGGSTNWASQGLKGFRKSVPAGTNWGAGNLTSDQSAYPFTGNSNPYDIDPTAEMDRVAVSTEPDNEELPVGFILTIPNAVGHSIGDVGRLYFSGPAGGSPFYNQGDEFYGGLGQYCIEFNDAGKCTLYEKLKNNSWWMRFQFDSFHNNGQNEFFYLRIYKSRECKGPEDGTAGWITFEFTSTPQELGKGYKLTQTLGNLASVAIAQSAKTKHHYRVPGNGTLPTHAEKIRVDIRRDSSAFFTVIRGEYPLTEVTANDTPFEVFVAPGIGGTEHPFELRWNACTPWGTSVDAQLMDAETDTELNLIAQGSTNYKLYETQAGLNRFYIKWTLAATFARTPVIKEWQFARNAFIRTQTDIEWEVSDYPHVGIMELQIRGAERDISHEQAEFTLVDPLNKLDILKLRSGMSVRIETEYDASDTTKRCVLFQGYLDTAQAVRMKPGPNGYPVIGANKFKCNAVGEWIRLDESFIESPILTLYDVDTGIPAKLTDFIPSIISAAGYDLNTRFDFPDLDIRLEASPQDYTQIVDMLEKTGDVVKSLINDYTGHFLMYDPNVRKWRLIPPSTSPYTNVAEFTTLGPPSDPPATKLVHYLPSYSGGTYPLYPIVGGTYKSYIRKPEANWIIVSSIGAFDTNTPQIYCTQPLVNTLSFNYMGSETADPNDPSYLGYRKPIYVIDPALGSSKDPEQLQNACNALARRIADVTFYPTKLLSFEAPLALIDHDTDVTKKRMLRFYDPVLVNGEQYLIRNVNPSYHKDGIQYASYELELPRI